MTRTFAPQLSILPEAQRRLWDELGATPDEFVLYGGTAIALHLGHRQSVDFDFFADCHIDPDRLRNWVPYLQGASVIQQEPDTLTCVVDRGEPVKVSFFGVPQLNRIAMPHVAPATNVKVASLLDLAGTKMAVVQKRAEAKDYIDIDAIIANTSITLGEALAAAQHVYGATFNPLPSLKALTYFDDGNLGTLTPDLKLRLVQAVRTVDPLRLPSLIRTTSRDRT